MEALEKKCLFVEMVDCACKGVDKLLEGNALDEITVMMQQGYFKHAFEQVEIIAGKIPAIREGKGMVGYAVRRMEDKAKELLEAAYTDRDYIANGEPLEHWRAAENCKRIRDWVAEEMNKRGEVLKEAACFQHMWWVKEDDFVWGLELKND